MPNIVVANAQLTCTFGASPAVLSVVPSGPSGNNAGGQMIATIMDYKPQVNIAPFGMCMSMANPQVASATSAAQGVLTPQPCIPMTQAPWTPGSPQITIGGNPALTDSSMCMCMWCGQISITTAGQQTTSVG